ncbi:MAG: glycosyltransferase, partial [Burkholderiaceae bacterium]|nr:glycosyltransferase [Burkholderiaceae bacterium]
MTPLRFPKRYLEQPEVHHWYHEKLETLRQFDHLLATSETTRRDAIELVGIDAARITTIHGGADARFAPRQMTDEAQTAFRARWGLKRKFVLYTGGDDFRKNLPGALAAYAELPAALRADLQLVYVCAISPETHGSLLTQARRCGLGHDEMKVTGYVSDDDLIAFYNLCDAFVFPSLYEGFASPVLQAMQCGAPVLGANNSSTAEIVGRDDALFDACVPAALAERLTRLLTDDDMRRELSRHGVERAKHFTWTRSTQIALDALHEAQAASKPALTIAGASLLPQRRIAIFTPLPPCRSGVADYNAALLPFLGRYFAIDLYVDDYEVSDSYLRSNFTIRPHQQFLSRADDYDAVVYEMGNSEFHAYMLDHLFRHPGIVVLHDAFLSGMYGFLDFNAGESGSFKREMIHSHGSRARRYFAPVQATRDPVGDAMIALPATKSVIDRATGIVSHSPFNREVALAHYPEGWAAPYRIVNQMTRERPMLSAARRAETRGELALGEDDFLVCTFGHVVWTKCGNLLLEAFRHSAFGRDPRARLLYVGELAKDDFGHALEEAIAASGIGDRVSVTGYVDEERYERFLSVTDLAVQLRTNSRGGTSKGVLDCLAHGVPVALNDAGSFEDYPDEVVLKLPAEPSAYALTTLFDRLHREPTLLSAFRQRGRDYVVREHGGERVAAEFALLVDEFTARQSAVSLSVVIGEVGGILAPVNGAERLAEPTARALHASLSAPQFAQQRILIDVSHVAVVDHGTGIQRVVRNVVRWLYCSARPGVHVIAVRLEGDELIEATDLLDAHGLRAPVEREDVNNVQVKLQWGDCLLMLDSSWERYREFAHLFRCIRELHGSVQTVVYDLLPLRLPQCWPQGTSEWFRGWIETAIEESDALICISRSVADELEGLMQQESLPRG